MTATGPLRVAYMGLAIVAAGLFSALLVYLMYDPGQPATQILEPEPFTLESSVKDVAALMGGPHESGTGPEYSEAVAANCPTLDVYPLADGAVLICR